jgi:hypothetical protein
MGAQIEGESRETNLEGLAIALSEGVRNRVQKLLAGRRASGFTHFAVIVKAGTEGDRIKV